jgi:hypothetical protein
MQEIMRLLLLASSSFTKVALTQFAYSFNGHRWEFINRQMMFFGIMLAMSTE